MTNDRVQKVYIDLIRDKNRLRVLVIAIASLSVLVVISGLIFAYSIYLNERNNVFSVAEDGNVSRLVRVSEDNVLKQEALFHCQYLFKSYFTYEHNNVDKKREAGLRLFDEADGYKLEQKWKNWFVDVKNQNLNCKSIVSLDEDENSVVDFKYFIDNFEFIKLKQDIYGVKASCIMEVSKGSITDRYILTIESKLRRVDRVFPWNPHGFIFFDFVDGLSKENVEK